MQMGRGLLALVVLTAAIVFFGAAPGITENSMNVVTGKGLIPVSQRARDLHSRLMIVDLHGDTLMWQRSLLASSSRGQIDLARMQQGNMGLQIFSSVTKTPRGQNYDANGADSDNITLLAFAQLQPLRTIFGDKVLLNRSLYHVHKLDQAVRASRGALVPITSAGHVQALEEARVGRKVIGVLFSAEGLQSLHGDIANLDRLHAAGLRMAGLTHFFDNELGGSMHGLKRGGLTPFGRDVVRAMEDKGIIVDIAHLSHPGVAEVLAMARRPVVSSHGGVQAVCKVNRNLTDEEIRGVAKTGGVIGIGYWDGALCDTSVRSFARSARHIANLVGVDHIALGSDFDGAVTTALDVSQLVQITQALIDEGFSDDDIARIMGGNAMRVLKAGLLPLGQGESRG